MDKESELKQIIQRQNRITKNKRWACSYPRCYNPAIGSHSQTVSSSLRSIAEDGHVMERNPSSFPIRETQGWRKIGINEASKFPGFCRTHDYRLFKQADSINKNNLTPKALTFLSYRTFAMEMRKKEIEADRMKGLLKYSDKFIDPTGEDIGRNLREGMLNCLNVTKPSFMKMYQEMIEENDYSLLGHKIYLLESDLGTSCAAIINPLDITEQPIDKPQPIICFNVLPRRNYTLVVFSYASALSNLVEQFIGDHERLEDLLFNYCEEVILNISLFESLDSLTMDAIEMAQVSWACHVGITIPNIFCFRLDERTLLKEL